MEIQLKGGTNEKKLIEGRIEEIHNIRDNLVSLDGANIAYDDNSYTGPYAKDLYQGDILLTKYVPYTRIVYNLALILSEQLDLVTSKKSSRYRRQAQKNSRYPLNLWKNGPIPYSFDSKFPLNRVEKVRAAIEFWQNNTCIRFKENGVGRDRIRFIAGNGCWSMIGKTGGEQQVSIGYGCDWMGTIAHELEHAFGVWHTQARYDRGYYVAVNAWNIQKYQLHNFDTQSDKNSDNLQIPYEFGSVMHYFENDFAIDRSKPTLVTRTGYERFQNSMSNYLPSFYDIKLINTYYKCYDNCRWKIQCSNGGMQDVNNCGYCKCPAGYSGRYCEYTVSNTYIIHPFSTSGCDRSMVIGRTPTNFTATTGRDGLWSITYEHCAIHLKTSDPSKRIELQITSGRGYTSWNCYGAGVDVRVMRDPAMTGLRYCRPNTKFEPAYSDGDHMVLNLFARVNYVNFSFSARSF
ncbi:hypothetical protein PFISCL1PPCAC_15425 [Pristionchus fissidentatus]|uniref:Zinc metalloproteinase n=1 Tax=Pristionchus fissidentatus TaxID=1538716 RepID=A0AAV5W0C0_9BILA|nr:hypothetical protein PFISCL1PPCAC_15425 [Pristionchus fissidentatus]